MNAAWLELASTTKQPFESASAWIPGTLLEDAASVAMCSQLAADDPQNLSARRCHGLALWLSGRVDEATDFWRQVDTSTDLLPTELYFLGSGLESQGRTQEADQVWQQADVPASTFLQLYTVERQRSGATQRAMRLAELAAQSEPDDPDNWLRIAAEYGDHGEVEKSIAAWKKAVTLFQPNQAGYWWSLGRTFSLQGEWREAAAHFARGVEIAPDDREMWRHLFQAYLSDNDYSQAADTAIRWATAMPADAEAYISAGKAFYLGGDDSAAQQWEERALAVDPSGAEAHRWLGAIAVRQGNQTLAVERLNRAIEIDPKYAEAYFDLAKLAVDKRDLAQAYTLAEQAIALYPWGCPSEWYVRLGGWAEEAGDMQQAFQAYTGALECDPNQAAARQALDALQVGP